MSMGRVVVVGSANVDVVVRVPHLPRAGETVLGSSFQQHMGGKGANQAVAAARLGADVVFVGAVGTDAAANLVLQALEAEGVDCSAVAHIADVATGVALITVDDSGENQIAVAPGANLVVDAPEVSARVAAAGPSVMMGVLEVPMPVVVAAAMAAQACSARVLINAAPAQPLPDALLQTRPLLIVNEEELRGLGASAVALLERGTDAVIVTRGADGVSVLTADGELSIAGEDAGPVVDSTGAGDAFCGGLAALLAENMGLPEALRIANAAAALSVGRAGARGGMVTKPELEAYLKRSPSV
jgi:ribokinase